MGDPRFSAAKLGPANDNYLWPAALNLARLSGELAWALLCVANAISGGQLASS